MKRKVAHTLMGTIFVIESGVLRSDVVQVRQTEANKVFEAFPFDGGNPRLRVSVGIGRHKWSPNDLVPALRENAVESCCEFGVPIMDKVFWLETLNA